MNEKDAIDLLRELQTSDDTENAHMAADDVLCQLLIHLGYKDVVDEYNRVDAWYA